jgi:hypothetical protein
VRTTGVVVAEPEVPVVFFVLREATRIGFQLRPAGRVHGSMIKWSRPIAASLSYTGCVSWTIITRILPFSELAK